MGYYSGPAYTLVMPHRFRRFDAGLGLASTVCCQSRGGMRSDSTSRSFQTQVVVLIDPTTCTIQQSGHANNHLLAHLLTRFTRGTSPDNGQLIPRVFSWPKPERHSASSIWMRAQPPGRLVLYFVLRLNHYHAGLDSFRQFQEGAQFSQVETDADCPLHSNACPLPRNAVV